MVVESYDEIVISEPTEALFVRIRNNPVVTVIGTPSAALVLPGKIKLYSYIDCFSAKYCIWVLNMGP